MRFMLMQHHASIAGVEPMSRWTPEEIKAHIDYQLRLNGELTERGELVDAQGLAGPDQAAFVTYVADGAPVVTDGPFPEAKEFLAGYRIVDVESRERATEIAAQISAAPARGGAPIEQPIEVREVMRPLSSDL
jgi:hypothetical protein